MHELKSRIPEITICASSLLHFYHSIIYFSIFLTSHQSIYLNNYQSIYLINYQSIYLTNYPSIYLTNYLSSYITIQYLPIYLSYYLVSTHLPILLFSIYPSIYLPIQYLPFYLSYYLVYIHLSSLLSYYLSGIYLCIDYRLESDSETSCNVRAFSTATVNIINNKVPSFVQCFFFWGGGRGRTITLSYKRYQFVIHQEIIFSKLEYYKYREIITMPIFILF